MNWKKVVGVILWLLAFIGLLFNGVYRGSLYFVYYIVLFLVAMGGFSVFLMGVADNRPLVRRFRSTDDSGKMEAGVGVCVEKMG